MVDTDKNNQILHDIVMGQQAVIVRLTSVIETMACEAPLPGSSSNEEALHDEIRELKGKLDTADLTLMDVDAFAKKTDARLTKVSVMLGYGGDVSDDFLRHLDGRPSKVDNPSMHLLPDGTYTNVTSYALAEWTDYNVEAYDAARQIAAERKLASGKVTKV